MIFPHAVENRKIRGICPCPAIREGGHARRGTSRQRAHKPRLRAPHRRIPPLLTLPQHIYYSTFRPKRKGFSFIIIVFCFGRGEMLFSVKADAFGSAAKQFKPHGSALRRGRGGDRKAPSSLPQERNSCATKKAKKHGCAPRRKAAFPLQNQKNHKKMTIRCNEIAFSFVLYHEGGYVIKAADSTQ